jgi:cell division protein FtsB
VTQPRRPAAGRRPAASRGRGRSSRAAAAPTGPTSTPAPARSGNPFTGRAALLGLVVCTLVFSAALPVREYVKQRSEISRLEADQAARLERVQRLQAAKQQLQDPAHIAAEARRRLHMALPGEVAYVLITPEPVPVEEQAAAAGSGPDDPWWGQVWGSVESADRPPADRTAGEPGPAPAPPSAEPAVP